MQHVLVGPDVHMLALGLVLADGGDGGGHGDEPAERDAVGVVRVGCRVGGAEEELAHAGFDAVAADHCFYPFTLLVHRLLQGLTRS